MLRVFRFSARLMGGPELPLCFVDIHTGTPHTGPGTVTLRSAIHCEFVRLVNRRDPFALRVGVFDRLPGQPMLTYLLFECDASSGELSLAPLDATDDKILTAGLTIPYGRFRVFNGDPSPLEILAAEA